VGDGADPETVGSRPHEVEPPAGVEDAGAEAGYDVSARTNFAAIASSAGEEAGGGSGSAAAGAASGLRTDGPWLALIFLINVAVGRSC